MPAARARAPQWRTAAAAAALGLGLVVASVGACGPRRPAACVRESGEAREPLTCALCVRGLQAAVARGGGAATSAAQRLSWEQRSSAGVLRFDKAALKAMLKQAGVRRQALATPLSEDEPPFVGADIAGAMADGQTAGTGGITHIPYEPVTDDEDYGNWGPAMTFAAHDTVARRVRDMVDDTGKPLPDNEYQTSAEEKGFIKVLAVVTHAARPAQPCVHAHSTPSARETARTRLAHMIHAHARAAAARGA